MPSPSPGPGRTSATTSSATTPSRTASRPASSAAWAPPSAPSPATPSTTSTSAGCSPARRWPASSSTRAIDTDDPRQPHLPHLPGALAGLDGPGHARLAAISSTTTPARTCSSRWTTGRSWWTTTCSSRPSACWTCPRAAPTSHNLFAGRITNRPEPGRETPYHPAHSHHGRRPGHASRAATTASTTTSSSGAGHGARAAGRGRRSAPRVRLRPVGLRHARVPPPDRRQRVSQRRAALRPRRKPARSSAVRPQRALCCRKGAAAELELTVPEELSKASSPRVTTALLGKTRIAELPYVNPDDSPVTVDKDFLGKPRDPDRSTPGPLESPGRGSLRIKLR